MMKPNVASLAHLHIDRSICKLFSRCLKGSLHSNMVNVPSVYAVTPTVVVPIHASHHRSAAQAATAAARRDCWRFGKALHRQSLFLPCCCFSNHPVIPSCHQLKRNGGGMQYAKYLQDSKKTRAVQGTLTIFPKHLPPNTTPRPHLRVIPHNAGCGAGPRVESYMR